VVESSSMCRRCRRLPGSPLPALYRAKSAMLRCARWPSTRTLHRLRWHRNLLPPPRSRPPRSKRRARAAWRAPASHAARPVRRKRRRRSRLPKPTGSTTPPPLRGSRPCPPDRARPRSQPWVCAWRRPLDRRS